MVGVVGVDGVVWMVWVVKVQIYKMSPDGDDEVKPDQSRLVKIRCGCGGLVHQLMLTTYANQAIST